MSHKTLMNAKTVRSSDFFVKEGAGT